MAIICKTNGHKYMVSGANLNAALDQEESWAAQLREALATPASYGEKTHQKLADSMERIEALLGNYSEGTIFDHVRSIFDDTVTRGFQHSLHVPQLINQFHRYATRAPPQQWVPPPDVQSRNASPVLPPANLRRGPPTGPNPSGASIPPLAAGASGKRKGKASVKGVEAKKPTPADKEGDSENDSEEPVPVTTVKVKSKAPKVKIPDPTPHHSSPEGEGRAGPSKRKSRPSAKSKSMIGQITDEDRPTIPHPAQGAILSTPPCTRCSKGQRDCWVIPKGSGKAACLGCRKAKMRCDLDGPAPDDEEKEGSRAKRVPRRAAPTPIVPGAVGEYAGECFLACSTRSALLNNNSFPHPCRPLGAPRNIREGQSLSQGRAGRGEGDDPGV